MPNLFSEFDVCAVLELQAHIYMYIALGSSHDAHSKKSCHYFIYGVKHSLKLVLIVFHIAYTWHFISLAYTHV